MRINILLIMNNCAYILLIYFAFYSMLCHGQQVRINEVMAKNNEFLMDSFGNYPDWIELYNMGDVPIDMGNFYLSDKADELHKYPLPAILLQPHSMLLVFASNMDTLAPAGEIHTNFTVAGNGEKLYLSNSDFSSIDSIQIPNSYNDVSYGYVTEDSNTLGFFSIPSPNQLNTQGISLYELSFSWPSGIYSEPFLLDIIPPSNELVIRYTTDGSPPVNSSIVYNEPIFIQDVSNMPDTYCLLPSTATSYTPKEQVPKINIIQAALFLNDIRVSLVHRQAYLISDDDKWMTMPILSVTGHPDDLFGYEHGIFVNGISLDSLGITNYDMPGNEWERAIHCILMDGNEGLLWSQDCGARIHGNGIQYQRQKSFRLIGDESYSDEVLHYQFFAEKPSDRYDEVIVRGLSNSANESFMSDEFASQVVIPIGLARQAFLHCAVFINGEFWGLYAIKERQDGDYIERNFGVDKDDIDLINLSSITEEGSDIAYSNLLDYIGDNDLSIDSNYQYVTTQLDIENYIDYLCTEFYFGNIDWPYNNIKFWRAHSDTAKWRWLLQDLDFSLFHPQSQNITAYVNSTGANNPEWATFLGRNLLANPTFRSQLIERMEYLLLSVYNKNNNGETIMQLKSKLAPLMQDYLNRYDYFGEEESPYGFWESKVEQLLNFAAFRPCSLENELEELYGQNMAIQDCSIYVPPTPPNLPINQGPHSPLDSKPIKESKAITLNNVMNGLHINKISCTPEQFSIMATEQSITIENNSYPAAAINVAIYDLTGRLNYENNSYQNDAPMKLNIPKKGIHFLVLTADQNQCVYKLLGN